MGIKDDDRYPVLTALIDKVTNAIKSLTNKMYEAIEIGLARGPFTFLHERLEDIELSFRKTLYLSKHTNDIASLGLNTFIKNKLTEGYSRIVVPYSYPLTETLVIEKIRNAGGTKTGLVIQGEGGKHDISNGEGHFILKTGGVGILLSETHSVELRNMNIVSGDTNPSTIGIVVTRDSTFSGIGSSNTNIFKNLTVKMNDIPTANNGKGTIGIYNNTGETHTYDCINVTANVPLVLTRYDMYSLCPKNTYNQSNKDHYFVGNNNLMAYGGANSGCLVIDGAENIDGSIYFFTYNPTDTSAAIVSTNKHGWAGGSLSFDSENIPIFLNALNGSIDSVRFYGTAIKIKKFINLTKIDYLYTRITGCEFMPYITFDSSVSSKVMVEQGAGCEYSVNEMRVCNDMGGLVYNHNGTTIANKLYCRIAPTVNYTSTKLNNRIYTDKGEYLNNGVRIDSSWGIPSSATYGPFALGDVYFNTNLNTGDPIGYIYNGTTFVPFGQNGYRGVAVSVIPTTTPKSKGEIIFDENNNAWIAYGTSAGQFKQLS